MNVPHYHDLIPEIKKRLQPNILVELFTFGDEAYEVSLEEVYFISLSHIMWNKPEQVFTITTRTLSRVNKRTLDPANYPGVVELVDDMMKIIEEFRTRTPYKRYRDLPRENILPKVLI